MGAVREGGVVGCGGELVKEVELDKPSSCVPSKLLDGGADSSTCGICSIIVQTRGLLDCCNHLFCFSCITEWFTVSNLCPLCKSRSRFITPQMLSRDTGRWERLETGHGSVSRDEGPSDEDGQPVSFPPYYIDEEAVLCLQGDSCLVRAGLLDLDAEANASSDTSVACDLCDCWYHGGCVNFQPDQTSFICPRCLESKEMDRGSVDAPNLSINLSTIASSDEKASSTIGKNQSAYGGQTIIGSASVAIEDPEEGESHVSISLRRIPDVQPVNIDSEKELMWSPIREPLAVPIYDASWQPVLGSSRGSKPFNERVLSSTREPIRKVPYFEEDLWSPTREAGTEVLHFQEEPWSPTPKTVKDLSFIETRSKFTSASVNNFGTANPHKPEMGDMHKACYPRAVVPPRPENPNSSARVESVSTVVPRTTTSSEVSRGFLQLNTTQSAADPMGLIKEEISIDVNRLQVAVEQLRKGKRKVLQEDERNIDVKDLPEMPRKVARKSARKVDAPEDKGQVVSKDLVKKATTDQVTGKQIAVRSVNSLESTTNVEALDGMCFVASNKEKRMAVGVLVSKEEKRMAAGVLVSKEEKRMAVDVPSNKEEKRTAVDVVSSKEEERTAVDIVSSKEQRQVVVDVVSSKEEKRMAANVSASKEERRMPVDVVSTKEERNMTVDVVSSKEEKRMAADVAASKEERRMPMDVVSSKEEKRMAADVVSNKEEKRMAEDVVASKDERRMTMDVIPGEQINIPHLKSSDDSAVKTEPTEVSNKAHYAIPQSGDLSASEKVEVSSLETGSEIDVMDIVRDTRGCLVEGAIDALCPLKGVKTRIIMHREPDVKDSARPSLVERIRQQMRDTAGYGAGDDLGKVEVSDDRFIAAFKAAQTRSYDKSKEVKSASSRLQSSGRLWKVLDKKYSAQGARDNLIRKLYAGGGRKCWDRDWDIAFWRERDPHQRRGRKEAEGEVGGSRKDSGVTDMQPDAEDAEFFNRLYVADTSLFPRNEDVKPLSVHANHAEGTCTTEPEVNRREKLPQPYLDKVNPTPGVKDNGQQSPVQGTSVADKLSKSVDLLPFQTVKKSVKPSAVSMGTSLNPNVSASSGKARGPSTAALKAQCKDTEATSAPSVKKDKRQWALEVLARKEGKLTNPSSSGNTGGGGSATKDNPFPLLLQLPVEMRPLILGDTRRNKIPPAVRQVQLNRLVEQELKRANLAVIGKSSECDDAIATAIAREEELCRSSNSKGVYLNRCVRALASTEYEVKVVDTSPPEDYGDAGAKLEESSRPEDDEAVRKALEDTGLMDSPIADPIKEHVRHSREDSRDTECKVLDTNGASELCRPKGNEWVENVLEVENADLDIYGDFEFNSDDELDGALPKKDSQKLKHISAASSSFSDGKARTGSLMVVLTTGTCQSGAVLESGEAEDADKKLRLSKPSAEAYGGPSSCHGVGDLGGSTSPAVEAETCDPPVQPCFDDADEMYDGLELNLNPVLSSEVMAHLNAELCASSPKVESRGNEEDQKTLPVRDAHLKKRKESERLPKGNAGASETTSEDDCMKFSDIDRRIENIRKSKAVNGDPHRTKKSKGRNGDANRTNGTSVQMQVEIYVNQHLKPLYRSQVITAEQFKWTVSKTAAKVMEHHGTAVNADFLITEGNKVRKLADQYLQAFAHRKA